MRGRTKRIRHPSPLQAPHFPSSCPLLSPLQLAEAESYEDRALIRQLIRQRKKDKGLPVGRSTKKGAGGYNRFAGSTAPTKIAAPKSFIPGDDSGVSPVSVSTYATVHNFMDTELGLRCASLTTSTATVLRCSE